MLLPRHSSFNLVFILYYVTNIGAIFLRTAPKYPESHHTDYLSDEEPIVAIVMVDENSFLRTENNGRPVNLKSQKLAPIISKNLIDNHYNYISDTDEDETNEEDLSNLKLTPLQKTMLREKLRSSCDKEAAKTCTKACNMARKNVCSVYHCQKGLSKRLKKECKRSCKSKFTAPASASSESD